MRTAVIIPLYNKVAVVGRALHSVLRQTVPVDDIIVVNDGSTDGSEAAARSVGDSRIRVVRAPHIGASRSRNHGASLAHDADILLLLDADDEWHPQFVETILALLRRFPEARAAATGYELQYPGGRIGAPPFCLRAAPGNGYLLKDYFRLALKAPPLSASSVGIYRSTFHELGGFRHNQGRGMDLVLWADLVLRAPVAFDPAILSTYHLDAENRICESVFLSTRPLICEVLSEYMSSGKADPHLIGQLAAYYDWHIFDSVRQNLIAGRPAVARAVLGSGPRIPRPRHTWLRYLLLSAVPPVVFRHAYRWVKRRRLRGAGRISLLPEGHQASD